MRIIPEDVMSSGIKILLRFCGILFVLFCERKSITMTVRLHCVREHEKLLEIHIIVIN